MIMASAIGLDIRDKVRYGLRQAAGALSVRDARQWMQFARGPGYKRLFRGLYKDFAAAAAAAPKTLPLGYDNEATARLLENERHRVVASDYPVMFWLQLVLSSVTTVLDFGGNVGISYYGFGRLMDFPKSLRWVVYDVPAVVARGREIASGTAARGLEFTTDLAELAHADVLLAAGSLQFLEDPLRLLRSAPLPPRVIVNKLPVYDQPSRVTLQATGTAYCPYHLLNRREFMVAMEDRGYSCVDEWRNYDLRCTVPFHPRHKIDAYSGFYFIAHEAMRN